MSGFVFVLLMIVVTVGVAVFFVLWWGWWENYRLDHKPDKYVEQVWRESDYQEALERVEYGNEKSEGESKHPLREK